MKKIFYIVFFANFAFFSFGASAQDLSAICRKKMHNPKVTITTSFGKLKYDNTKSRRAISRLHIEKGGKLLDGKLLNGISTFEHKASVEFKINKKTLPSGIYCYYPTEININIGAGNDPVIYIAKEFQKDSCLYNVTMRHEQTHQHINQSVLEYYAPIVKERMLNVVQKYSVAGSKKNISLEQAKMSLQKRYMSELKILVEEIRKETAIEQEKLDTVENYIHDESLCL